MHTLGDLPYEYDALEPYIDVETMHIHHDKHHAAYVDNLNKALSSVPELADTSVEDLLKDLNSIPESIRTAVRNHGGGHANHTLFWSVMCPASKSSLPQDLEETLIENFGSIEDFKKTFTEAAMTRFGSGWAWLVIDDKKLSIMNTANQDSPLSDGFTPILGIDVWEHAYYLKYQNKRPEYIEQWWNIVNWEEVLRRYKAAS